MTRSSVNLQRAAFIIAMILFAFVGAYVLSSCGHYEPPCSDCWKAL